MQLGTLKFKPLTGHPELVAEPIRGQLEKGSFQQDVYVVRIDPTLADTAAFCERYDISLAISTNCIIIEAKRADSVWYVACLILATDMIDVNNKIRHFLEARKVSFAPKDTALSLTGMEYGGITPLGLPEGWPILVDEKVLARNHVVIGSGVRASKIALKADILAQLPNAHMMDITK